MNIRSFIIAPIFIIASELNAGPFDWVREHPKASAALILAGGTLVYFSCKQETKEDNEPIKRTKSDEKLWETVKATIS